MDFTHHPAHRSSIERHRAAYLMFSLPKYSIKVFYAVSQVTVHATNPMFDDDQDAILNPIAPENRRAEI